LQTNAFGSGDKTPSFARITGRCQVHLPFAVLLERLDWVLANRLQPEIGLEGDTLYATPAAQFARAAAGLRQAGLGCTLHAPFLDLAPGGQDRPILMASRHKLRLAFELIKVFQPRSIVCHLGYEDNKHDYKRETWFATAAETWQELLPLAARHQTIMMLENTYETGPEMHQAMFTRLNSPYARLCLDLGHVSAFARGRWQDWLPALDPWLGQLHLHDNHGQRDDHLPVGEGCLDFAGLFAYLHEKALNPLVTLEPHSEKDLWQTIKNLDRLGYLDTINPE